MRNPKTAFMARQERMMDSNASETTQDSLNVRIAKRLGWRIEPVQKRGFTDFVEVWSPDGKKRGLTDNGRWSEWIHQSYLNRVLPNYEGDLNAGMNAVPREYSVIFGSAIIGGRYCVIDDLDGHKWSNAGVYSATDSLALARALDAMRQQQERPDAT